MEQRRRKADPEETTYYSRSSRSVGQRRRLGAQKDKSRGYNHRSRCWGSSVGGKLHSAGIHAVLKKRNLPTVRLEQTFLPEPSVTPSHKSPEPQLLQEHSAWLSAKKKLALLGRWPGSTHGWGSQGAPEDRNRWDSLPGLPSCHLSSLSVHLLPTLKKPTCISPSQTASHSLDGSSSTDSSLGCQSW